MIRSHRADGLCTLTIDRQDSANALTAAMLADLVDGVATAAADPDTRVLVLSGAGKVFSAGAELDEVRNAGLATSPLWEELSAAIAAFRPLTIAALNGTVAGGAMGMVLACDIRLAVPEARFFYPVLKIGVKPQPSDPPRLVSLVGPARAKLILMCGQKVPAAQALDWGLVDHVVDRAALAETVDTLTTDLRAADPVNALAVRDMI